MKLKTRAVAIAGITSQPHEAWLTQVARNLTDARDGFLRGVQYLILDRDPLYTAAFTRLSIATVLEILERLRAQGLVRLQGSDPYVWVLVERQP